MEIKVNQKDVLWGYVSHLFSMASVLITLPIALKLLTPAEVGFNYLMITVGTFVTLLDFGFAPQFGRNFTYIYSGAQKLQKEGINHDLVNSVSLNYHLLLTTIKAAKYLYTRLSGVVLIFLLTIGSIYIYEITDGFTTVNNSIIIWLLFSISVYFDIYFAYYSSLLHGKGMITEFRKALVYSKLIYVIISVALLLLGFGLISIVIANFVSPFVHRYICNRFFFTTELTSLIDKERVTRDEIHDVLSTIWFNAKKLGVVYLGSYTISKIGLFIAGLYLSLEDIASYGLMCQVINLITVVSTTLSALYAPRLTSLRVKKQLDLLLADFSFTLVFFVYFYLIGSLLFILFGKSLLALIGSTVILPNYGVIIAYCLVTFLETNHSIFSSLIVTNNEIPFAKSTIIAGVLISILSLLVLRFTDYGIISIIIVPGVVQAFYNNWKWPLFVCQSLNTTFLKIIKIGSYEVSCRGSELIKRNNLLKYRLKSLNQ
jgi:O-antigen/teichoic acid export membrane protein